MSDVRYPVGGFQVQGEITPAMLQQWMDEVAGAPARLREAVAGLNDEQLNTPYREGGWSLRQVVHHLADSHLNSYVRVKLALTEENPTIKPYDEATWAELPDSRGPVEPSLALLESLHERWVLLMKSFTPAEFARTFHHPQSGRDLSLAVTLGLYAWHGRHHTAHITGLRQRMGW